MAKNQFLLENYEKSNYEIILTKIIIDVSTTGFMYVHYSLQLVEVNIAVHNHKFVHNYGIMDVLQFLLFKGELVEDLKKKDLFKGTVSVI